MTPNKQTYAEGELVVEASHLKNKETTSIHNARTHTHVQMSDKRARERERKDIAHVKVRRKLQGRRR